MSRRPGIRSTRSVGLRDRIRAAASSRASGRPSSCRQMSTMVPRLSPSRLKSGRTARARSANRATAGVVRSGRADGGGTGSGATGRTCSPATPSLVRLVARTTRRGQPRSSDSTKGRMPSRRCSQLSRTSSMCRSERKSTTDSTTPVSADRRTPSAVATAALAAEGSVTGASSHQETPSANGPDAAAAFIASRVLPTPPTPMRVTSREPASAATASATSWSRPTKLVSSTGRTDAERGAWPGRSRRDAATVAAVSCRQLAVQSWGRAGGSRSDGHAASSTARTPSSWSSSSR